MKRSKLPYQRSSRADARYNYYALAPNFMAFRMAYVRLYEQEKGYFSCTKGRWGSCQSQIIDNLNESSWKIIIKHAIEPSFGGTKNKTLRALIEAGFFEGKDKDLLASYQTPIYALQVAKSIEYALKVLDSLDPEKKKQHPLADLKLFKTHWETLASKQENYVLQRLTSFRATGPHC